MSLIVIPFSKFYAQDQAIVDRIRAMQGNIVAGWNSTVDVVRDPRRLAEMFQRHAGPDGNGQVSLVTEIDGRPMIMHGMVLPVSPESAIVEQVEADPNVPDRIVVRLTSPRPIDTIDLTFTLEE